MARHTSDGSRRGLAPWVIVTAVAVLVIAGATTAYVLIVNGSDDEANAGCTGQVVLPINSSAGATPRSVPRQRVSMPRRRPPDRLASPPRSPRCPGTRQCSRWHRTG